MTPKTHTKDDVIASIDEHPLPVPIAVALTDLDGFAALNERRGREVADAVLNSFDDVLRRNIPSDASAMRIGGDEWVVIFPGRSVEASLVLMEELRAHLGGAPLVGVDEVIRMSAGVAGRPPHGDNGAELLRAADEALMRGKRSGRNQVVIHVEDKMVMKSNYYSRATLDRLSALSRATNRTEASLLREAADRLLADNAERI